MYRRFLFILLVCSLGFSSHAQTSSIKLFADFPVQFGLGYEGKLSNRFSLAVSGGAMMEPNSSIMLFTLESIGVEKPLIKIVDASFQMGVVAQAGLNYNFGKNYIGTFGQVMYLLEADTRTDLIETYFETSMDNYPLKSGASPTVEPYLNLQSTLYQAGILYGRRFALPSKHFAVNMELGVSANVWSHSKLTSEVRNIHELSQELNDELSRVYRECAFIPSLRIALVYHLKATPF